MSASTIRRIRRSLASDNIIRFFLVAGIDPVEGVHFEYGVPSTKKLLESPSNPAMGPAIQFESLTRTEKMLAAALTLFAGGWTEETGRGVCGDETWESHKGLLAKGVVKTEERRFRFNRKFLSVVEREASRQKAVERFAVGYVKCFFENTANRYKDLYRHEERRAVSWFIGEHANVRRAFDLAVTIGQDWYSHLEYLAAFYFRSELYEEGIQGLEGLLDEWGDPTDIRYVNSFGSYAKCWTRMLDYPRARVLLKKALRLAEDIDEPCLQIDCHSLLAGMASSERLTRSAHRVECTGKERHRKIQSILQRYEVPPDVHSRAHFNYALSENDGAHPEFVRKHARLSYEFACQAEEQEMIAASLTLLAEVDHDECELENAIEGYGRAIEACKRSGNALRLYSAVIRLGEAHLDSGDYSGALANFRWANSLNYLIQNDYYPVLTKFRTALAHALSGRKRDAIEVFYVAAEDASLQDFALPLETESYLSVVAILADNAAVRAEAFLGLRNSPQYRRTKSKAARERLIMAAGGIDEGLLERPESLFDGLDHRRLFQDLVWMGKDGIKLLRLMRSS